MLYTQSIGDPSLSFFHARIGAYFQDDYRPKKGLTLSPGVRYSYQTRVDDLAALEPRLGVTWAPTKSGNTTLRASAGIFHGWLDPGIWWQTVRYDGDHQREVVISNPPFPDPGASGPIPLTNTYRLGEYRLNKNIRYSAGIDQKFSPRASVNVLFNYYHQDQLPRGNNLNPLVNGVRPDPSFANIISTVTDAELIRHELYVELQSEPGHAVASGGQEHVQLAAPRHERRLFLPPRAPERDGPVRRASERVARHRVGPRPCGQSVPHRTST